MKESRLWTIITVFWRGIDFGSLYTILSIVYCIGYRIYFLLSIVFSQGWQCRDVELLSCKQCETVCTYAHTVSSGTPKGWLQKQGL